MIDNHSSLWQFTARTAWGWATSLGRVIPLAFVFCYSLFYWCQSLIVYKCLVLTAALADVWVFYRLVKQIGKSTQLALLSAALVPLFIQFRAGWDPLLSFSCLYPLLALLLFSSLLLFSQYLESPSVRLLSFSLLLFWLSTLMFELVFPLGALYVVIPWRKRRSLAKGLRLAAPFLAVDAIMVGVTFYLRAHAPGIAHGPYAVHLSPIPVLQALFAQVAGVIPLLYGALHLGALGEADSWIVLTLAAWMATLGLFWMLRRPLRSLPATFPQPAILPTGLVLLFASPLLICFSDKYQQLTVADSYLPIYLSCFGAALLLSIAILRLAPKLPGIRKPWILILYLCAAATGYAWNFRNNVVVVAYLDRFDIGREPSRTAAAENFFSGLREGGLILTLHQFPWEWDSFFAQASGHRQTLLGLQDSADYKASLISAGAHCSPEPQYDVCTIGPEGSVFFFRVQPVGPRSTALILSRLKTVVLELGFPRALTAADTDVFLSGPTQGHAPFSLAVRGTSGEIDFWLNAGAPKFQRSGWQWFQIRDTAAEATSLKVYLDAPQPPALPPMVASLPASRLSCNRR